MRRSLVLILLLGSAAACDRRDRFAAPDSSSAPKTPVVPERAAHLSISDLSPGAGDTVVVTGTLKVSDDLSLGSFRVRLGFDSTKLRYLEEIPSPGMMRVVNPQPGNVIVVGASSSPGDGILFAFRLRADDPAGINSLVLRIDELNDVTFKDQRATVTQAAAIMHDGALAKLVSGRAVSREGSPQSVGAASREHENPGEIPVIDSISPRAGELENDRVTDIVIYGKGFASRGNLVTFGGARIPSLMSEAGGTVIRFSAPSVRVTARNVAIRVSRDGVESNAVTFTVRNARP